MLSLTLRSLVLASLGLLALSVPARAELYLRFIGTSNAVPGNSNSELFPASEGWLRIDSAQFGMGRAVSTGGGGGTQIGLPQLSDTTVTLQFDASATAMLAGALVGRVYTEAELAWTSISGSAEREYLKVELAQAVMSSLSLSSGGDRPTASASISFIAIRTTYTEDGGKKTTAMWNIATARAEYP